MTTKSRETIYGASIRAAAAEARKDAERLACEAWNKRGFRGPAQPSPTLGDALNAGYGYLEQAKPPSLARSARAPRRLHGGRGSGDGI